jgi:hypothetical protein
MVNALNKPLLRLLGGAGFLVTLLIYQGQTPGFTQQLLIPLAAAACAWLACQNLPAVAFGTGILSILASNLADPDMYPKVIYPAIALLCLGYLAGTWGLIFRQRIADTREERWRHRRESDPVEHENSKTGETGSRSVNLGTLKPDEDIKGNNEF